MSYSNHFGQKEPPGQNSLTMRILIIGGCGFVGGRLAVHLAEGGHEIMLGSRHACHAPFWLPQAAMVQIEWDNASALERCCKGVDLVIHAAGMNAQECAMDPVSALTFNGVATTRLVWAAIRSGVARFIYFSTAHVYASPLVGIITEESCPRNLHPYATSHLAGEQAVLSASKQAQMEGIVVRLSNAFGAPMQKEVNCWMLLVNDLCQQAVETRKLVLQTSGLQHRDFIGLTSVCRVVEALALNTQSRQSVVCNVGSGVSQSLLAMTQQIQQRCAQVLGFEPELQRVQSTLYEHYPEFTFRTDNLAAFGINSESLDVSAEIDSLLRFCHSSFIRL